MRRTAEQEGLYCRPRFSPGYGDFSIKHQRDFFPSARYTAQDRSHRDRKLSARANQIGDGGHRSFARKTGLPSPRAARNAAKQIATSGDKEK